MTTDRDFLAGGGDMGVRIRSMDWSCTPLGPPEHWPQSLRSAVSILLPSKAQIVLFWGPDLVTLYNDAYRPVFGTKHPSALGMPAREAWREIWHAGLKDLFEGVLRTGEAFWAKDRPFVLERNGFPEETFFDVSYDPVRDETGAVGGVFCIVSETTGRVLGERRLTTLRELASTNAKARSLEEACALSVEALQTNTRDIPFALLYPTAADGTLAPLGSGAAGSAAFGNPAHWPLQEALRTNQLQLVRLDESFGPLPHGAWDHPPQRAAVMPLAAGQTGSAGVLVTALNPFRPFDEDYRAFLELAATQVAAGIASAVAYEQERKRAEALASLDRAKTAFFSNVSHEFRTPLTLMLGPLDDGLADADSPLPPPQRERLELARRSGLRLQKLVNTLLDFSRLEAGRAQAAYQPTDLGGLTVDLASSFRSVIEKGGLQLVVDCPALPDPVYVDRDMWEKIVLNLLSNAFKFTFIGAIVVTLRQSGDRVDLAVRDSGIGIPATELPHLFERFRRVEGARCRTHEGTGIGLALVRELVKLHGGAVSVDSVEGEGTTFTVSIPLGTAHLPQDRVNGVRTLASTALDAGPFVEEALRWLPDSPESEPVGTGSIGAPRVAAQRRDRIVWADDNADMREYVRRLLSPRYDVETVSDGVAALAAVRARRPDLVLADVMMPQLDGLGLVRALRADADTRTIPIILLSARAGEESRIEGLDAGADDYLHKPFGARELLAHVAARLEMGRLGALLQRERSGLADLFVQTPVPTAVLRGPTLVFEMANPAYIAVVGGRDIIGKPLLQAMPEIAGQGFDEVLRDVMRTGKAYTAKEALLKLDRRGTGELEDTYWTLIYAPMAGLSGDVDGVIAICNEVTDQVRARDALRDADRRKDEFLATLAHELRNPLAPLRNSLHLLRMAGDRSAAALPIHDLMERQVNHLVRLVDDLLEVSRISRGTFELRKQRVDLAAVVRNAIETSDPLIQAAGHGLRVALPEESLWLEGDPVRLAQILSNLLNNAAKYTEPGGQIAVDVRRDNESAVIAVRDTGMGIAPEALVRMFEMFSRGHQANVQAQGGLGIGLALSRRLAEMHGGTITAHSDGPGKGSEFTVRLPLAIDQRATAAVEGRPEAAVGQQRILVVDDNRDSADSLCMVLSFLGADVQVARDGGDALASFRSYDPEVVLLDIGMPGMDGYEVARRIRAEFPERHPAIVALTGWGQEADRRKAREAGFDHHIIKPADIGVLRALLASVHQAGEVG